MKLMPSCLLLSLLTVSASGSLHAQSKPVQKPAAYKASEQIDLEMMTWVEVKEALVHGKTTALIYNGGIETRGPQAVLGGHTFVAHAKVLAIAKALGNAVAAPVLPFAPKTAFADLPGTVQLHLDTFKEINKEVAEEMIRTGFKNVVLMADHAAGQKELGELATELTAKYAAQGIHVVYCGVAYTSNDDFDKWIATQGLSPSGHASVNDTSEMMYLEPAANEWVRRDKLAEAVGTKGMPVPNGVSGDARKSSEAIGQKGYQIHVDETVAEIKQLLAPATAKP